MTLKGFLPPRAILMGKSRPLPHPATRPENITAPHPTLEAPPILAIDQPTPRVAPPSAASPAAAQDSLERIAADLAGCTRCKLCATRKTIVIGEGNPQARLAFVGEGPGEQEDLEGRPFVGKAGQLLDRMIQAIGLQREEVYIANVVKCRPPGNRDPEPDEITACGPFLLRQLETIRPQVVVALGRFAAQTLLQTETPISRLRGSFHPYRGAKLMPTFHPSYLLRNPASKRDAWLDLQQVARELGLEIPQKH